MKLIRFQFSCSRPVPLYAQLCNQYLSHEDLTITVGYHHKAYFIEAEGNLAQLTSLADAIAVDFLISVWLIEASTTLITSRQGSYQLLDSDGPQLPFCQQCQPDFGDNQAPHFGHINQVCSHCYGQNNLSFDAKALTAQDLKGLSHTLMECGQLTLPANLSLDAQAIHLSLKSSQKTGRELLLICNPNSLNSHFFLTDQQVLALSSIEKPVICARTKPSHPQLSAPLYNLSFANSRLLLVICEHLRQRGIDWIYLHKDTWSPALIQLDNVWLESESILPVTLSRSLKPLFDSAVAAHYYAYVEDGSYHVKRIASNQDLSNSSPADNKDTPTQDAHYSQCALHSAHLELRDASCKNSAVLYLSERFGGQLLTIDGKSNAEVFLQLPRLPQLGHQLVAHLASSPQQQILTKFNTVFGDDYQRLLELDLADKADTLSALWAVGAVILGLKSRSLTVADLRDALIAAAMDHHGKNAPRIDYPLIATDDNRSINWCKTLGSLMSFRLADNTNTAKLAFGMQDSLADYLANWIEHLDSSIGITSLTLAGSEWSNPVLARQISLRIGKNTPIIFNQRLDIDGNNLAIGALLLKQRRK